ncbi:MarR family winged helix-turn-helix transcriptional regulator [Pelagibius sp. Alg239-R121]|uniref:MarR family winged helix-turn-helix transcriptional regulator n=1 Tax=Pelagibius sp. Alg239-R121 TaxID=2993448 RepID=UPI0024A6BEF5|nr:MarR family transcriptional regulator [Pelagibius sp. Alg239-R121]
MTRERRAPSTLVVPKTAPLSKQRLRLWLRLLRATRFVEGELRERLRKDYDATLPRFDVLAALYRCQDGMTMTELSRFLMVSNGNVTGIVDRLVQEGLVVRVPDENDRRATFVRLTPKGVTAFGEMAEAHEGWVDGLLSDISAKEAAELITLLSRFNENKGSR